MIHRIVGIIGFCLFAYAAFAGGTGTSTQGPGLNSSIAGGPAPPLSCTEGTNYVNRAITAFGSYNTAHQDAANNLLCGMVAQASTISGTLFSRTSVMWLHATQDEAVARLNVTSSSFTLSVGSAPTFTADRGYTGNGSSQYMVTNWAPSLNCSSPCGLNSMGLGSWVISDAISLNAGATIGSRTTGVNNYTFIIPQNTGTVLIGAISDGGTGTSGTVANGYGLSFVSRNAASGAGSTLMYKNASSTPIQSNNVASVGLTAISMDILAFNTSGTHGSYFNGTVGVSLVTADLSGADYLNLYNLIRAYLTAVGAP